MSIRYLERQTEVKIPERHERQIESPEAQRQSESRHDDKWMFRCRQAAQNFQ